MARPTNKPQRVRQDLIETLPKRMRGPGPLDTVDELQKEWQRIHREFFRGRIEDKEYSTLQYGMQTGTAITRIRDELKHAREELQHLADLKAQLKLIQNGQASLDYMPATDPDPIDDTPPPLPEVCEQAAKENDIETFKDDPEPRTKRSSYVERRLAEIKGNS
jgi:hypothetical protein